MTMHLSEKDWILLSRYLAGALSRRQTTALTMRLTFEPELDQALNQLKSIRALLSSLPEKRVPHSFTIKAGLLPKKHPPVLFPAFRTVSVVVSMFFVIILGLKIFTPVLQNESILMANTSSESQPIILMEDTTQLAAPKASAPDNAIQETTPLARTAAGAGQLMGSQPEQPVANESEVEEKYNPQERFITWNSATWVLGILSLALIALTVFLYFRERV